MATKGRVNKGFGERLKSAIREKGYVRKDGEANVTQFALRHGHAPAKANAWAAGTVPRGDTAAILAEELGKSLWWLVFGEIALDEAKKSMDRTSSDARASPVSKSLGEGGGGRRQGKMR